MEKKFIYNISKNVHVLTYVQKQITALYKVF